MKSLKLFTSYGDGSYASGSMLVAAESLDQAIELVAKHGDNDLNWDRPELVKGIITGAKPGVIHHHAYRE